MMLRPHGYSTWTDRESGKVIQESDNFKCGHCQRIVLIPSKCNPADLGGHCRVCERLVCPQCHAKGACTPWEEEILRMEAKFEARRSYGF